MTTAELRALGDACARDERDGPPMVGRASVVCMKLDIDKLATQINEAAPAYYADAPADGVHKLHALTPAQRGTPVHMVHAEVRLNKDNLPHANAADMEAMLSTTVARDLAELWVSGDVDGDDPLLALRDGANKGNTDPLNVHNTYVRHEDDDVHNERVYTVTVLVS